MVADALVYHPALSHYIKFQSTVVGRDKLLRTLQYFSRFYAWYLLRTDAAPAAVAPFDALKRQAGLVRKVMRVGKFLEHLRAASVASDAAGASDQFLRFATIGRQLGYTAYLGLDALTVLDTLGIRRWDGAKRAQREAWRFWVMGLLFGLAAQVYTLASLRQREAKIDKKDGEGVVESKRITKYVEPLFHTVQVGLCFLREHLLTPPATLPLPYQFTDPIVISRERGASQLQLISDLCDLTIPTSGLGWTSFDDGFVGLAGTVSSLIGVYNQWVKT